MLREERLITEFVRERVAADVLAAGPLEDGELLRFDIEDGEVVATAFGGQAWFPVPIEEGPEEVCRFVMSEVQDGVMGRQHRLWPEVLDGDGGFVGVLEPGLASGIACWSLRGVPFCAVGQLSAAIPAAGLRLAQGAAR